ncbi:protein FAM177A1-like [Salvelinus namaycush]|uniref:Protein FAM177A1-like n=1 Tax=Salvelinus namaycush TaxID=8040 RepID=A0A8U0P5W4_SALNM|nr:protein FAM177A1-like [Salvelinus namaycush]
MYVEKSPNTGKDNDSVELGDLEKRKERTPRRIIHFSNGETMEEYNQADLGPELLVPHVESCYVYSLFPHASSTTATISTCFKNPIIIPVPKEGKKEEEDEDNRLSEEAEQYFDENRDEEIPGPLMDQPKGTAPHATVTYQVENKPEATPTAIRVPTIVTTTD